jgi:predicted KAP-like P-loop ATPase
MTFNNTHIELIKIVLTFLTWISVIVGWIATDYFAKRRDVENQKRKIRTEYLVNVFRFLATSVSNRNISEDDRRKLEDVVADIQLFGTPRQIHLLKTMTHEMVKDGTFDLDPILNDLRDHLRRDLNLESIEGNVHWLRDK